MRSVPVGAPQPWPPPPPPPPPLLSSNGTDNNKQAFCTPGICTFACPQWCATTSSSFFLPPPPPFLLDNVDDDDDSSSSHISPLMAALIAVLAAAFLILFYYTVLSRFFRRQRQRQRQRSQQTHILNSNNNSDDSSIRLDPMILRDPSRPGLDDAFIRQITVFRYRREDGLIDGSECAVCLSEFKEEESLRLMPNCEHAFHIPCIDTWLKTQSSCPLCRATMNPVPVGSNNPNAAVSVSAMQVQRSSNDVVLVVREVGGEVIVCHEVEGGERENMEGERERKGEIDRR